jgi:TetR/AcrR family transcriptional regulator, tetracycline repressor protein
VSTVPLERAEVVRVALTLLDEVGLDGLSLRKLATKLGVQAPTWDEWLSWMALNMRAAMLAHRDGALLHAAARPSEGGWEAVEAIVAMLRGAGFSQDEALQGLGVLTDYVLGATLEEQAGSTPFPVENRVEIGVALILDGMRARVRLVE